MNDIENARLLLEKVGDNPQFDALIDVLPAYARVYNYRRANGTFVFSVKTRRHRYRGTGTTLNDAIAEVHNQVITQSSIQ